ncbi:MAG: site-2 protease family protein [Isosphaeraceae bacterium]
MAWSWRIGKVAGIPIYMHWTFLILIAWVIMGEVARGSDLAQTTAGVLFALALFGCVVLHELGHALAARRFGIPTLDITLLPIGGLARMQRIPEKPAQELVVAIAGPLVNVAIAGALLLAGVRLPVVTSQQTGLELPGFWTRLLLVNMVLVLFNLLPAFPMDGGRVLRALLAMRMNYARATRLAASVGQFVAIGFALLGLSIPNPFLLLISLFVWTGAEAEASQVEERAVLQGVPVRDAMLTDFQTLGPDDTLGHAADLLLAGSQHDFPVLADGRFAGLLSRSDLLAGLAQGGRDARVSLFARTDLATADAGGDLVPALAILRESGGSCLAVVEQGRPVGLLTVENVAEYLMVRTALRAPEPTPTRT